ncbi:MAG: hypothetical protein HY314_14525, partial [Acidobacteria bacterium]|nr:hypothetical protein [Acidobacteriota bacterium]
MIGYVDRVTLHSRFVRPLTLALGWLLLIGLALGGAPRPAPAQDGLRASTSEPAPQTTSSMSLLPQDLYLKLRSELVVLPISVTDPLGRFITGLRRDQFEISEQDVLQTARFFSTEDVPISIGIILDTSGSMK